MRQYVISLMIPQAIHVAGKLDIASRVENAPATVEEPASATASDAPSLRRLLKFLMSAGIFSKNGSGKYHQTQRYASLRPSPVHARLRHPVRIRIGVEAVRGTCHHGCDRQPAFDHVFGASFFEYLSVHPKDAAMFNNGMTSLSFMDVPLIIAAYDFSAFNRIVDLGGGGGALLQRILSANPKLHGVLFDLTSVVKGADALRSGSLGARCEIVGGDVFQNVPGMRMPF
jgi:hypothetical protein